MEELLRKRCDTQHGFNSEREETSYSLDSGSKSNLKNDSQEHSDLHLEFHITHTIRTLLAQFTSILRTQSFNCSEIFKDQLLVVRLKLRDKLAKLFACVEPPKFVLKLATDEFRSLRIMTIRPLKMSTPLGKSTSEKHKKQMKRIVGLLKRFTVLDSSVTIHEQSELDSDYRQDFYQLESTAYYMFGKMLTDSNYSIGKKVQRICEKYNQLCQQQPPTKNCIMWLNRSLNEVSDDLLEGFNCSRKELLQILCFCRRSVQEYFYTYNQIRPLDSDSKVQQSQKGKEQLIACLPHTYNQLQLLEKESCSMGIFKQLFMIVHVFKVESHVRRVDDETKKNCAVDIRNVYSSVIVDKIYLLKAAGYCGDSCSEIVNGILQIRKGTIEAGEYNELIE